MISQSGAFFLSGLLDFYELPGENSYHRPWAAGMEKLRSSAIRGGFLPISSQYTAIYLKTVSDRVPHRPEPNCRVGTRSEALLITRTIWPPSSLWLRILTPPYPCSQSKLLAWAKGACIVPNWSTQMIYWGLSFCKSHTLSMITSSCDTGSSVEPYSNALSCQQVSIRPVLNKIPAASFIGWILLNLSFL